MKDSQKLGLQLLYGLRFPPQLDLDDVKELIAAGAEVDYRDSSGETPLMWAVRYNNTLLAKMLIEAGADMDARNRYGETACDIASAFGQAETRNMVRQERERRELTERLRQAAAAGTPKPRKIRRFKGFNP
ncbi:MAG: ankyrin repeat domain-containing protein [Alphaproteobacteria bacterium]|nr:ankyrin repeat domain-containing protein [Alphaproteobacteria bacterium]